MTRKFTHINEAFTCLVCLKEVETLPSSCRNHCPFCLSSCHVDIMPGDRQSPCKGTMDAVGYSLHKKKGIMLHHKCRKCGEIKLNKACHEASVQPDDYDKILSLTKSL